MNLFIVRQGLPEYVLETNKTKTVLILIKNVFSS